MANPQPDLGMPLLNKKALMTVGGITLGYGLPKDVK